MNKRECEILKQRGTWTPLVCDICTDRLNCKEYLDGFGNDLDIDDGSRYDERRDIYHERQSEVEE